MAEVKKALELSDSRNINFIPTMGNLHDGHFELIRKAKKNKNINLVSIYVNPLQFNDIKDLDNYPRSLDKDLKNLTELGVSMVYLPEKAFNLNNTSTVQLGEIVNKLCGKNRKGHFEGVATVILKVLLLIKPEQIYLGEKDFQQILVIKKIIKDFNFDVKVKTIPIIRGPDGIALSSRNQRIKNINNLKKVYDCLCKIKIKIDEDNFHNQNKKSQRNFSNKTYKDYQNENIFDENKKSVKLDENQAFPQFNLNVSNPISWKLMLLIMLMQLLTNIMLVVVLYLK